MQPSLYVFPLTFMNEVLYHAVDVLRLKSLLLTVNKVLISLIGIYELRNLLLKPHPSMIILLCITSRN